MKMVTLFDSNIKQSVTSLHIASQSKREFFLIHGYTGSPTDFNDLPSYLSKQFDAAVRVVLLKGHGTRVEDLDTVEYEALMHQIEGALQKDCAEGKKIVVGGVSFGAQAALVLAARYPVQGVFAVSVPYQLRFPFSIPSLSILGRYKKYWKKSFSRYEKELRQNAFSYSHMHYKGLAIVHEANRDVRRALPRITCPVLVIQSKHDPIAAVSSIAKMRNEVRPSVLQSMVWDNHNHNIFYSPSRYAVYHTIERFFRPLFFKKEHLARDSVAAIIPAYNEAERIGEVLDVVTKTKSIDKIVVIDDGSHDDIAAVVRRYPSVLFLKNKNNRGKAYSLQRGIDATKAPILFFCDADLVGLTPAIIEQIIKPVKDRLVDMFIGIRNNVMQKTVHLFAVNSGERALRRETWEQLPERFKHGFKIEVGLNYITRQYGRGYDYAVFPYYQTVKEKKYGVVWGTILRWRMNIEVGRAYLSAIFDRFLFIK